MPLILTCLVQAESGDLGEVRARRAVPLRRPELTIVSFSYKRNGFASFATKRSIKISFSFCLLVNRKVLTTPFAQNYVNLILQKYCKIDW